MIWLVAIKHRLQILVPGTFSHDHINDISIKLNIIRVDVVIDVIDCVLFRVAPSYIANALDQLLAAAIPTGFVNAPYL
jgi:hypothetical protein